MMAYDRNTQVDDGNMTPDVALLVRQNQIRAAADERVPGVPERIYRDRQDAAQRLTRSDLAIDQVKQQVALRVRMEGADNEQHQRWEKDALLGPNKEKEAAQAAYDTAVQRAGEQNEAWKARNALEASYDADIAAIDQQAQQRKAEVDRKRLLARSRCATE